ncbi:UNVERIFIED_CONTAM: hypothetical protein FKN15_023017 [Acipenser sinensis]
MQITQHAVAQDTAAVATLAVAILAIVKVDPPVVQLVFAMLPSAGGVTAGEVGMEMAPPPLALETAPPPFPLETSMAPPLLALETATALALVMTMAPHSLALNLQASPTNPTLRQLNTVPNVSEAEGGPSPRAAEGGVPVLEAGEGGAGETACPDARGRNCLPRVSEGGPVVRGSSQKEAGQSSGEGQKKRFKQNNMKNTDVRLGIRPSLTNRENIQHTVTLT